MQKNFLFILRISFEKKVKWNSIAKEMAFAGHHRDERNFLTNSAFTVNCSLQIYLDIKDW